jgi:trehalose 6-phosphate synthase/phosphatase
VPRLVIVSNRLPFTAQQRDGGWGFAESSGGLVSALSAYLADARRDDPEFECIWVGWPGAAVPESEHVRMRAEARAQYGAFPVFLSEEEVRGFYQGFSNATLWPLFHWAAYARVNGSNARCFGLCSGLPLARADAPELG